MKKTGSKKSLVKSDVDSEAIALELANSTIKDYEVKIKKLEY